MSLKLKVWTPPSGSRSSRLPAAAMSVACLAVLLSVSQGVFFYHQLSESAKENASLRLQIAELETQTTRLLQDGRVAVRAEITAQLPSFVKRAANQFRTTTLDAVKVRSLVVVDSYGAERIELGTGRSEFSGEPNTYIKMSSPAARNPIILSTTNATATVSVSKRAMLSATDEGNAYLHMYRDAYVKGAQAALVAGTYKSNNSTDIFMGTSTGSPRIHLGTNTDFSRLMLFDAGEPALVAATNRAGSFYGVLAGSNRFRAALGLNSSSGLAFSELYNVSGEMVYAVQSTADPFAKSFIRADPASRAWNAASTFSTLKTFWDILRK